jgi:hypothetical protein
MLMLMTTRLMTTRLVCLLPLLLPLQHLFPQTMNVHYLEMQRTFDVS